MGNPKLKLILASASPRRKELLGHLHIPFDIIALNGPEESSAPHPATFCQEIAEQKGQAVVEKLLRESTAGAFFVVSADTIVALGEKVYGKPKDVDDARAILRELAGKTHSVFTAVSLNLIRDGKVVQKSFVDESLVTFAPISDKLLENYLRTGDSLDKAGAYGIQGGSLTFIESVKGSYSTVVGFPLSRFVQETQTFFQHHLRGSHSWFDYF